MAKMRTTGLVLAAMTMLSLGAQERMNVVLKEGTVQNFNLPEVEQVVFDSQEAVSLQVGNTEDITTTNAIIFARLTVDDANLDRVTYGFLYETSSGTKCQVQVDEMGEDGIFCANLSDLMPGTTYYYQPYALLNGVYYYGATSFFRTKEKQADNACVAFLSPYTTTKAAPSMASLPSSPIDYV